MPENTTRTCSPTPGTSSTSWRTGPASSSTPGRASTVRWSFSTCQWWRTRWAGTTTRASTSPTPPVLRYKCQKVTALSLSSGYIVLSLLRLLTLGGYQLQHTEAGPDARRGELLQHQVPSPGVRAGVRGGDQGGARDVSGGGEPAVRTRRLPAGLRHVPSLPVPAALQWAAAALHLHHQVSERSVAQSNVLSFSYSGSAGPGPGDYRQQELDQSYGGVEQVARHTPPPPYSNTNYSSFSPCSSSSASLSPPIPVPSRSEISSSPVKSKYNRRNNPELEKRRTHHCDFPGCTKVYTKSSHLKAHQRIHTGKVGEMALSAAGTIFQSRCLSYFSNWSNSS